MKLILFGFLVVVLSGCGKAGDGNLDLRIQFPDSIKKGSARYERFIRQAEYLELHLKSADREYENRFPPMQWETLSVPDFELSEKGVEVEVRVWDRTKDGSRRNYPVLEGKKKITAGSGTVLIKLALKIAPENWD